MTVVFMFKHVNFDDIKKETAFKYKLIVAPFQLIGLVFDYFCVHKTSIFKSYNLKLLQ